MIGQTLGPYHVLEKLGEGGMGEVYRARDPRLNRDVAIKVLRADVASNPDRLRRFEQEARAAGALSHPNLLTVYDVGSHEGVPYATGRRQPWKELRPADPAGVFHISSVVVTPDGRSYAYTFASSIGSLYLAEGIR